MFGSCFLPSAIGKEKHSAGTCTAPSCNCGQGGCQGSSTALSHPPHGFPTISTNTARSKWRQHVITILLFYTFPVVSLPSAQTQPGQNENINYHVIVLLFYTFPVVSLPSAQTQQGQKEDINYHVIILFFYAFTVVSLPSAQAHKVTLKTWYTAQPWWKTSLMRVHLSFKTTFTFIYPLTPSGTWRTPGLSIHWCCLPTSFSVCLVFFPLSLCLARWFWLDLMNGKHVHTNAVCVSFQQLDLHVVWLPAGSWHRLPGW